MSPFFLTCAVYFLLWIPEDQVSWVSALVKCLPVLCLAVSLQAVRGGRGYHTRLQGALLSSAVGDACLIWPEAFLFGEWGRTMVSELHLGTNPCSHRALVPLGYQEAAVP